MTMLLMVLTADGAAGGGGYAGLCPFNVFFQGVACQVRHAHPCVDSHAHVSTRQRPHSSHPTPPVCPPPPQRALAAPTSPSTCATQVLQLELLAHGLSTSFEPMAIATPRPGDAAWDGSAERCTLPGCRRSEMFELLALEVSLVAR